MSNDAKIELIPIPTRILTDKDLILAVRSCVPDLTVKPD